MFKLTNLHKIGTAFYIFSEHGKGFPLHKFDKAQAPLIKLLLFEVLLMKFITESTPFYSITLSLKAEESPAKFPIAQIA